MGNNREIVIIIKTCIADFPPILALLDFLNKRDYKIYLIVGFDDNMENIIKPLCFKYHNLNIKPSKNKFYYWYRIRNKFWKLLKEEQYLDKLLWLPAADTTLALGRKLLKYNYVLNLYELFDYQFMYVFLLKKYARKAKLVICSNMDRANIVKVWWKLNKLPEVILNKPLPFQRERMLTLPLELHNLFLDLKDKGKKILMYQGLIAPERPLECLCEALVEREKDYVLVIMGRENEYLKRLKNINSNIIHINFVTPPIHLHITSYADIGILNYDHSSLNNIFCAPNKLWEFSNFSIPMIGNKIPGLLNTIEKNKMGICVDFTCKKEIMAAIDRIDSNYNFFEGNAKKFYDDYNYEEEVGYIMSKVYDKVL